MGDEDGGHAELALNLLELDLHRSAQVPVERRERLVEQQHLGTNDERARERNPLLLAAGELTRLTILQAPKLDQCKGLSGPPCNLRLGDAPHLEAVADIGR